MSSSILDFIKSGFVEYQYFSGLNMTVNKWVLCSMRGCCQLLAATHHSSCPELQAVQLTQSAGSHASCGRQLQHHHNGMPQTCPPAVTLAATRPKRTSGAFNATGTATAG
jgi:hypothetical protein